MKKTNDHAEATKSRTIKNTHPIWICTCIYWKVHVYH